MSGINISEHDLKQAAALAVKEAMVRSIDYGAIRETVKFAVDENSNEIKEFVSECLKGVFDNNETRKIIREEFTRKVAKSLVGDLQGAVEKQVSKFKADPTLKAQMIIAIQGIISA